jgi:hypothetical protein
LLLTYHFRGELLFAFQKLLEVRFDEFLEIKLGTFDEDLKSSRIQLIEGNLIIAHFFIGNSEGNGFKIEGKDIGGGPWRNSNYLFDFPDYLYIYLILTLYSFQGKVCSGGPWDG